MAWTPLWLLLPLITITTSSVISLISVSAITALVSVSLVVPAVVVLVSGIIIAFISEVIPLLISVLPSTLFPPLFIARVEINSDQLLVQFSLRNIFNSQFCILMGLVDNKAKPASNSIVVDSHNYSLDLARPIEQLFYRILSAIIGEVAYVNSGRCPDCLVILLLGTEVLLVVIL